ncbi:MAG: DUF1501 domain-containing protein [Planctomycetales bacterium]
MMFKNSRDANLEAQAGQVAVSRRSLLQSATSGLGLLALASTASAAAPRPLAPKQPHFVPLAKRVIFLCMRGGPSHVDLFDHKPILQQRSGERVDNKRGFARWLGSPFKFAQHGESGLWISEVFPRLARHADKLCVINSMHTDLPNHPQAFLQLHTGSFQFVRPSLGAWTLYGLGTENENLPGFITLNPPADFGGARNYGNAFLPAFYQGTKIGGGQIPALYAALLGTDQEPGPPLKNISNVDLSPAQQRAQLELIKSLDQRKLRRDQRRPEIEGAVESFELAFRMQDEVPKGLDLRSESKRVRELYGVGQGKLDRFARQCLTARRLVEAGTRFVEVTAPVDWDHHRNLKKALSDNCAATDRAIAGLLTDLQQRGMLEDTLVVWAGEFGRTPYAQGLDGRDHNHRGYTVWLAGGGTRGGVAHGATDEFGRQAVEKPVHLHDLHATILRLLGLDHTRLTYNHAGREFRLTDVRGEVVSEIIRS